MKIWEGIQALLSGEEGLVAMLGPVGLTIVAVAALAAGLVILWERSSTFRKIVEGAFRAVQAAAKDVWDWLKGHWKLLAAILLAAIAPPLAIIGGLFLLLHKPVEKAFDAIKKIVTGAFGSWWKSYGKEIEQVWHTVWGYIRAVFSKVWDDITGIVTTAWDTLVGIVKPGLDLAAHPVPDRLGRHLRGHPGRVGPDLRHLQGRMGRDLRGREDLPRRDRRP